MDQLDLWKTVNLNFVQCKDFESGEINALVYVMEIIIADKDKGTILMKVPAGNRAYTKVVNCEEFHNGTT